MANFPFTSAKVVLARVIRALGYKLPSTYHDDILEWVPEGMGLLNCTPSLILEETSDQGCVGEYEIKDHCVKLPRGFVQLEGVYDGNGHRYSPGNQLTRNMMAPQEAARASIFAVNPYAHQTSTGLRTDEPGNGVVPWSGSDLTKISYEPSEETFVIKGNNIQTSTECGYVKIRYYTTPVCDDGYPMIPDNENFRQALEWHIIRRLIAAGYVHQVFTYFQADELFERSAARAVAEITYPTPDKAARTNRMLVRLIPPDRYTEDYFING